jgi:hypothetical protein
VIPAALARVLQGGQTILIPADVYLDLREPSWARFEALGLVTVQGRTVVITPPALATLTTMAGLDPAAPKGARG